MANAFISGRRYPSGGVLISPPGTRATRLTGRLPRLIPGCIRWRLQRRWPRVGTGQMELTAPQAERPLPGVVQVEVHILRLHR